VAVLQGFLRSHSKEFKVLTSLVSFHIKSSRFNTSSPRSFDSRLDLVTISVSAIIFTDRYVVSLEMLSQGGDPPSLTEVDVELEVSSPRGRGLLHLSSREESPTLGNPRGDDLLTECEIRIVESSNEHSGASFLCHLSRCLL